MSDAPYVDRHIGGKRKVHDLDGAALDRVAVALARRQHGVVARRQLLELGAQTDAIDFRLRRGRFQPVYRAVYAVGHDALKREGRWLAAVLASGPGAVLSHRPAAALWGIAGLAGIDVTAPKQRRPAARIALHVTVLAPDEITYRDGIRVTTVTPNPVRPGDRAPPASAGKGDE